MQNQNVWEKGSVRIVRPEDLEYISFNMRHIPARFIIYEEIKNFSFFDKFMKSNCKDY